jgi:hypothetical protein
VSGYWDAVIGDGPAWAGWFFVGEGLVVLALTLVGWWRLRGLPVEPGQRAVRVATAVTLLVAVVTLLATGVTWLVRTTT